MPTASSLLDRRAFAVALGFGLAAFLTVSAGLSVPVPGTGIMIDLREVFVALGGALAGPFWGALVGLLAGLSNPVPQVFGYAVVQHVINGVFMGAAYWYVVRRFRMPALLLAWMFLIVAYYLTSLPGMYVLASTNPSLVAEIIGRQSTPWDFIVLSFRSVVPEFLFTLITTTGVLAVLPRQYRRPLWVSAADAPGFEPDATSGAGRGAKRKMNAALLTAVGCGLSGMLVIVAKIHCAIPGAAALTDPREIFTCLGSAIGGVRYSPLVGFLVAIVEPNSNIRLYVVLQHLFAAICTAWGYRWIATHVRSVGVLLVSWSLLVASTYYVMYLPGFFFLSAVAPGTFSELVGRTTTAWEILPVMMRGWFPECILTMVVTSATLFVLPERLRRPLDLRLPPEPERDRPPDRSEGRNVLGLRLTVWFLLLSFVPLIVIGVFVQNDVATELSLVSARQQEEIARILADDILYDRSHTVQMTLQRAAVRSSRRLVVIDRSGRCVADIDSSRLGSNLADDLRPSLVERILSTGDGNAVDPIDGRVVGFASVGGENLIAVSILKREVLAHSLSELERLSYIKLSASLFILSLVGGLVIWIVVARPMRRLTWAAQQVGQGNLQASVDATDMDDEVGILAAAFNEMTASLRSVHEGLESEVAQRRLAEQALRERERQFRLLAENATDMISLHNARGEYVYVSPSSRTLLGYEPDALVGRGTFEFIHPDDVAVVSHAHTLVLSGVEVTPVMFRLMRSDGHPVWVESITRAIRDEHGAVRELQVTTRDISRRKQAEQALVASEERLRTVIANSPVMLFAVDGSGILTLAEGKGLDAVGMKPGQDVGLRIFDIFRDNPKLLQNVRRGLGGEANVETVNIRGSYFELWISPVHDGDDGITGIIGVATNVTERLRMEKAVRESEAMYKALVEQSSDAIYVLQDRRLVFVNRAWLSMFGYAAEEVAEPEFQMEQIAAPESRAILRERLAIWEKGDMPSPRYELRGLTKSGEYLDLDVSVVRIEWNGRWAVQGIYRDVSERKRSESLLLQKQKIESLGVLAGGVAHDFNNLLQAMLGHISLSLLRTPPGSPALPNMQKAEMAAERAAELTRQLLAYSGRGKFTIRQLRLDNIIEENLHLLEVAVQKSIRLDREFLPDLPPIDADAGQIQQVVMNLIINASEAIGERPGRILLRTAVRTITPDLVEAWSLPGNPVQPGDYVMLEVTDDGSGMNPETLHRIFDPFFTTKFTGRGLGLSAVMGIIRGHHGGMQVESEVGKGTSFRLIFPRSESHSVVREQGEGRTQEVPLEGTVLVIDDEADVREVVVDILREAGLRTLVAPNGEAGLEVYRSRHEEIAIVLLDLSMPGLGGRETFRRLKELDPNVRVIMSSGFSESEATIELKNLGLAGFIQKPYRWNRLTDLLREVLRA